MSSLAFNISENCAILRQNKITHGVRGPLGKSDLLKYGHCKPQKRQDSSCDLTSQLDFRIVASPTMKIYGLQKQAFNPVITLASTNEDANFSLGSPMMTPCKKSQFITTAINEKQFCPKRRCDPKISLSAFLSDNQVCAQSKIEQASTKNRLTQRHNGMQEQTLKTCEQAKLSQKILTVELVTSAVTSLYLDRIRPVLLDVFQRVKHQLKTVLEDSSQMMNHGQKDNFCLNDECHSHHFKNKSTTDYNCQAYTISAEALAPQQKAIDSIDSYILFVFIRSVCGNKLYIDTSSLTIPPHLNQAFRTACRTHFYDNMISPTPSLCTLLNQMDVKLRNPPRCQPWVDPHNLNNPYSKAVWRSFGAFLTSRLSSKAALNSDKDSLPYHFRGGRYGLALSLREAEFPALRALTLGELCHLVQLAITGRLLAYEYNVLQPVASCIDISKTFLKKEENSFDYTSSPQQTQSSSLCSLPGLSFESSKSTTCSSVGQTSPWGPPHNLDDEQSTSTIHTSSSQYLSQKCIYESIQDLAHDLDILLSSKPEGLVTAQLKKELCAMFHKSIVPQNFGYKKLTECLINNPHISKVCQVVCLNPSFDHLLLIHRKFLVLSLKDHKSNYAACDSSPETVSTAASLELSSLPSRFKVNLKSQQVYIPDVTLEPFPALLSISYNAGALSNFVRRANKQKNNNVKSRQVVYFNCMKQQYLPDEDDDLFMHVQNKILREMETSLNMQEQHAQLNSVFESYSDCYHKSDIVFRQEVC